MPQGLSAYPKAGFPGALHRAPVGLRTPIEKDYSPGAVRFQIDWESLGAGSSVPALGVDIDLLAQAVQAPLDKIRAIFIDNTFSNASIYIWFADTQYPIVCPPNATILAPVFSGLQEFTVYGEGFYDNEVPTTEIICSNVEKEGLFIQGDPRTRFVRAGPTDYRSEVEGAVSNPQVYNDLEIGAAVDNRVIAIMGFFQDNNPLTISALTLDGAAMTMPVFAVQNVGSGSNPNVHGFIAYLPAANTAIASATQVSFSLTTVGNISGKLAIMVYSLYNLNNIAPENASAGNPGATAQPRGTPMPGLEGAVILAASSRVVTTQDIPFTGSNDVILDALDVDNTGTPTWAVRFARYPVLRSQPMFPIINGNMTLAAQWR